MLNRSSGVLLNISSLPSDFGIGDFSHAAREFGKNIFSLGFHWWQILPLTSVGVHNSPYDSQSAYAGNYLYIDPYGLVDDGLLAYDDVVPFIYKEQNHTVDYDTVKFNKRQILKLAFEKNTDKIPKLIESFEKKNAYWLDDYASYMAFKSHYFDLPWEQWERQIKFKKQPYYDNLLGELSNFVLFFKFEQYLFWKQWNELKKFLNAEGIKIMGDMPIYVGYDSCDVFYNTKLFQLDAELNRKSVAGVPPDYFAEDGQLWNNPLYDYKQMEKDDYKWLTRRILRQLEVFDAVRIDHFRGFYEYYSIDAGALTAKDGKWKKGPGIKFFNKINAQVAKGRIIAEDLGVIDQNIRDFVEATGYPGMRVFEFGFSGEDSCHLPHNYLKNTVAYTGTHDNDTVLGWLYSLPENLKSYVLSYCGCQDEHNWGKGGKDSPSVKAIIRCVLASVSQLAFIPMQDICGYGSDTRMNVPGVAEGNWKFRLQPNYMEEIDSWFFVQLNNVYHRNNV